MIENYWQMFDCSRTEREHIDAKQKKKKKNVDDKIRYFSCIGRAGQSSCNTHIELKLANTHSMLKAYHTHCNSRAMFKRIFCRL